METMLPSTELHQLPDKEQTRLYDRRLKEQFRRHCIKLEGYVDPDLPVKKGYLDTDSITLPPLAENRKITPEQTLDRYLQSPVISDNFSTHEKRRLWRQKMHNPEVYGDSFKASGIEENALRVTNISKVLMAMEILCMTAKNPKIKADLEITRQEMLAHFEGRNQDNTSSNIPYEYADTQAKIGYVKYLGSKCLETLEYLKLQAAANLKESIA